MTPMPLPHSAKRRPVAKCHRLDGGQGAIDECEVAGYEGGDGRVESSSNASIFCFASASSAETSAGSGALSRWSSIVTRRFTRRVFILESPNRTSTLPSRRTTRRRQS